jgi:hypothetical protein
MIYMILLHCENRIRLFICSQEVSPWLSSLREQIFFNWIPQISCKKMPNDVK